MQSALSGVVKRGLRFLMPGVKFRYHLPHASKWGSIDIVRVNQIVTNGASNAGKFTTSGSVTIFTDVVPFNGKQFLVIDIINTGTGLPSDIQQCFIPFKGQGTSGAWVLLGLCIARVLVYIGWHASPVQLCF